MSTAVATSSGTAKGRKASSIEVFKAFEKEAQSLRRKWRRLCGKYDIEMYTADRGDGGIGEVGRAAYEARYEVARRTA